MAAAAAVVFLEKGSCMSAVLWSDRWVGTAGEQSRSKGGLGSGQHSDAKRKKLLLIGKKKRASTKTEN